MRERLLHIVELLLRRKWLALVIGVAGMVAMIVLGIFGFQDYYANLPPPDPPPSQPPLQPTVSTIIYLAVQLLILQSGAVNGPIPWQLEVSRVLAPIFTAIATIAALVAVFAEQLAVWRLRLLRDHIVVCGIGRKGRLIVEDLLDWGFSVVAVEPRPLESGLAALHQRGLHVVVGDATDATVLRRAGAHHAQAIVAACGNDASNIDIALQAVRLASAPTAEHPRLYVHLQEPTLQSQLDLAGEDAARPDRRWHFFNVYDRAAESILARHFVFDRETVKRRTNCDVLLATSAQQRGGAPAAVPNHTHDEALTVTPGCEPRLAVIGDAPLADSLIENLVEVWRPRWRRREERIGLVLIGATAGRRLSMLRGRIPDLDTVCAVTLLGQHVGELTAAARRAALEAVTTVYVCQESDAMTASTALSLWRQTDGQPTRVIAGFDRQFGLAQLVHDVGVASASGGAERLITFSIGETCRLADLLLNKATARLGKHIHEEWKKNRAAEGKTAADNVHLDETNAAAQAAACRSSQHQARHAPHKLEYVGCTIKREARPDPAGVHFSEQEITELAKLEHDRWNDERLLDGWELGPADRRQQMHDNLTPWECVPTHVQEYDVQAVKSLPRLLAGIGFEIVRKPERR